MIINYVNIPKNLRIHEFTDAHEQRFQHRDIPRDQTRLSVITLTVVSHDILEPHAREEYTPLISAAIAFLSAMLSGAFIFLSITLFNTAAGTEWKSLGHIHIWGKLTF